MLRSFEQLTSARKISLATVFLDVRSAFHCLLREHAFGNCDSFSPTLRSVLQQEGLDPDMLTKEIRKHAAAFTDHIDAQTARVIQDAHQQTWFVCPQSPATFVTHRGSRPGSPLADLAYNALMCDLLKTLQQKLRDIPHILEASLLLGLHAPVLAWVDDVALMVPCRDASALDSTLEQVMTCTHAIFESYGLRLNCAKGKTEAIVFYRGPEAASLRRTRFIDDFGLLPVPGRDPLRFVSQYTHLGLTIAQSGDVAQDVCAKIGKAGTAFRMMNKTIFGNRRLPVSTRLRLLESLVLPIVFYGAGSWPTLAPRLFQTLDAAIVKWQRRIIGNGFWSPSMQSDAELRDSWKLPCLALRLMKHRLLFLIQMHRYAPHEVWDVVTAADEICSTSWLSAVRPAIAWFAAMNGVHDLPFSTSSDILSWLSNLPSTAPKMIRRAILRQILQEHTAHMVLCAHRELKTTCIQHGVQFDEVQYDTIQSSTVFSCSQCCMSFTTIQGLNAHRWRQHQSISEERSFVYSSTCLCCGKCFWTSQRLQQHLRYSRRHQHGCFWWHKQHIEPKTTSEPIRLPELYKGRFRLPWIPAHGPAQDTILPLWEQRQQRLWHQWQTEWRNEGFPEDLPPEFCQIVHDRLRSITIQWTLAPAPGDALAFAWCDYIDSFDATDHSQYLLALWSFGIWGRTGVYDLIAEVEDPDLQSEIEKQYLMLLDDLPISALLDRLERLHRFVPPAIPVTPLEVTLDRRQARASEPLDDLFNSLHTGLHPFVSASVQSWPDLGPIPVCRRSDGSLVCYIVHLFSGRRRPRDCHFWVQALQSAYFAASAIEVVLLSLDTAVCGHHGNLLEGDGLRVLQKMIGLGLITASLSGPPCETWSAARHLPPPLSSTRRWPRPLRSATRPWGLAQLSLRELEQLHTGSALMLSNVKIEVGIVLQGGAAIQEHPSPHSNEDYASIWRTSLQQTFCYAAPGCQRLQFQQWRFGADAVKPTTLRLMGLPPMAKHFHGLALDHAVRPQGLLAGVDASTGQFHTARAKEYPDHLCMAMVDTLFAGLAQRRRRQGIVIRDLSQLGERDFCWLDTVVDASSRCVQDHFFPDYQPFR